MTGKWSPPVREAVARAQRLERERVARMSPEAQDEHGDEMAWREAEAREIELDDMASGPGWP